MKAYLLAAGLGTRLRPLTETTPKCLVPIAGKPLLTYWMELLTANGVTEVLINTHYLHEQVEAYAERHNWEGRMPQIRISYETQLLGSGGTVRANAEFVRNEQSFFICYADNFTNINLTAMKAHHESANAPVTVALFHAENPKECGIAELNGSGMITEFIEKPEHPKSNLANAGVYLADKTLFEYIPNRDFSDFGKDVLPKLTGRMSGWVTRDYLLDIGTPEKYARAQIDAKQFFC